MQLRKQHVSVQIGKLTNSIENTISGDSFKTNIDVLSKIDLKLITKKNGWFFDWGYEFKQADRLIYKLTIVDNPHIIQGLISISDYHDHVYLHLIESAPFNLGKKKLYEGVPGNLIAYACKKSVDLGYDGFVSFTSKTRLISHYEKVLGAIHVGGHKMIIYPDAAFKLISKYFNN